MTALNPVVFGVMIASIFVVLDTISTLWAKTGSLYLLFIMFLVGPLGYILFGLMTRTTGLAVASGLVNTWIVVGGISVGLLFFRDPITAKQVAGLTCAVLSVYLLS